MPFQKYDIDSLVNGTGNPLVGYMQSTSQQTGYIGGILLVSMIYVVLFLALKLRGYSTVSVFAVTNFVNMLLCIFIYALGIIPGWLLVIGIMAFPVSLFMLWVTET